MHAVSAAVVELFPEYGERSSELEHKPKRGRLRLVELGASANGTETSATTSS